ncbi:MAG: hypothetical protein KA998_02275 [Rickettsiaceae bacterium]|nr:hypothetical protein [Rickettsiaceae bacterium]
MTLSFINLFQNSLYELLKTSQIFYDAGIDLYISPQQDRKCPFILINILKVENMSIKTLKKYMIDFQICIFTKDKKQDFLFKIAEEISNLLNCENLRNNRYDVIGTNFSDIEFTSGHDSVTKKVTINYKSLIQVV